MILCCICVVVYSFFNKILAVIITKYLKSVELGRILFVYLQASHVTGCGSHMNTCILCCKEYLMCFLLDMITI